MNGYAIVHVEADQTAASERILEQFNEYMQKHTHGCTPAFVTDKEGYFRLEYGEGGAYSTAIEAFGTFLVSSGYAISGISSVKTLEGNDGTQVQFSRSSGNEERVVISTLNVY
jgi:hypothetical protein